MIKSIGLFLFMLLKAAGCIVLVLLLFLVAILLLVLLTPVRYRVEAQNSSEVEAANRSGFQNPVKTLCLQIRLTWLLHFIHVSFEYDHETFQNEIRIAGIDIRKLLAWIKQRKANRKTRKDRLKTAKAARKKPRQGERSKELEKRDDVITGDDKDTVERDDAITIDTEEPVDVENAVNENTADTTEQDAIQQADAVSQKCKVSDADTSNNRKIKKKTKKKDRRQVKGNHLKSKSSASKMKAADTAHKESKTDAFKNKTQQFHKEFTDETNRNAVKHVWKEICFLFLHYKPRKLKADLTFSLANPATTGEVLGILSLFPVIYRYPCNIIPDFESDALYLEGSLMMQGRVSAGIFLISFLRLFLDKETKQCIRRLMG